MFVASSGERIRHGTSRRVVATHPTAAAATPNRTSTTRASAGASSVSGSWPVNQYALPQEFAKPEISMGLHGNADDARSRFNRAENLGAIPLSDPDFDRLHALRPDAESLTGPARTAST
jgi:hypothetical protein